MKFGEAADGYDAVRPGYPGRLVQILITRAGLGSAAKVLEIGCGTGQLTSELAPTGCEIVCLEPDWELARLATQNFSGFPKVQVRVETFEQFDVGAGIMDLVVAATSFHWIDPGVRCHKAASALHSGAALAILKHEHPRPWAGFFARVQDVYRALAPELARECTGSDSEQWSDELTREITASGLFADVETFTERWERRLDRHHYLALLGTFSPHRQLPEARRVRLFTAMGKIIDEEYDGYIEQPYSTTLCLAQKAQ
jgi:SAM-dependent methyltransferase